jgi:hypothetical protein
VFSLEHYRLKIYKKRIFESLITFYLRGHSILKHTLIMSNMKKICYFLLISISLLFSCKKSINLSDSVSTVKRSVQSTRTDVTSTFADLLDVPVNIIVKENNVGKTYLTCPANFFVQRYYNGSQIYPPFFSARNNDSTQVFYLTLTPSNELYIQNRSVTGAKPTLGVRPSISGRPPTVSYGGGLNKILWKIYSGGTLHEGAYIIENTEYNKVLGGVAHNADVFFDQYLNLGRQEFEIRPIDDFELINIQYINDASATITQQPDFVTQWFYSNNTSIQQSMSTSFSGRASYTSSFSRTTGGSISITTGLTVGIPSTVSGSINTNITMNHSAQYGKSETKEDAQTYNFPINVAPRTSVTATATVSRYLINLKYKATLRGINTGKLIQINGIWEGISCTDVKVALVEKSLDTGETLKSTTLSKIPKTTFKFN